MYSQFISRTVDESGLGSKTSCIGYPDLPGTIGEAKGQRSGTWTFHSSTKLHMLLLIQGVHKSYRLGLCSASYHYATKITEIQYSTFIFQRVLYSNYVTPGDVINDDEMCAVNEISHIPHFPLLRVNLVLEILKSEIQSEIHRERSGNQANGLVSHMETT